MSCLFFTCCLILWEIGHLVLVTPFDARPLHSEAAIQIVFVLCWRKGKPEEKKIDRSMISELNLTITETELWRDFLASRFWFLLLTLRLLTGSFTRDSIPSRMSLIVTVFSCLAPFLQRQFIYKTSVEVDDYNFWHLAFVILKFYYFCNIYTHLDFFTFKNKFFLDCFRVKQLVPELWSKSSNILVRFWFHIS